MSIFEQADEAGVHIRPLVKKHYSYFKACCAHYGADTVKKVLSKGKHEGFKLKFLTNKKDRYQMLQLLDLI